MSFVDCVVDPNYEIFTEYPYIIRKKVNQHILSESISNNGYLRVKLSGKDYYKHRVIALQFISNDSPEQKTEIDHIDTNRLNNHIDNLRWTTKRQNNLNRSSTRDVEYQYINEDDLPDDLIIVDKYSNHTIEAKEISYYFSPSTDLFYLYNGIRYRALHINYKKNGGARVQMYNDKGKQIDVYYLRFKKQYDLI